jgi:hypothetical protein
VKEAVTHMIMATMTTGFTLEKGVVDVLGLLEMFTVGCIPLSRQAPL